jgi:hypothetical protein
MLSHTGFLFDINHQDFVAWVIDHDLIHQSEQKELQPRGKQIHTRLQTDDDDNGFEHVSKIGESPSSLDGYLLPIDVHFIHSQQ